ncbi:MAG: hypothetical protein WBO55_09450 [Rhizobiaceae bacterium]
MTNSKNLVLIMAGAILVAGCQSSTKVDPLAGGGGLTGSWAPDTGGYSASFQNGTFSTTALDTGNIISQGNYVVISETKVNLNWQSNITGTQNQAECLRPEINVLSCTDGGGKTFTLRRVSA